MKYAESLKIIRYALLLAPAVSTFGCLHYSLGDLPSVPNSSRSQGRVHARVIVDCRTQVPMAGFQGATYGPSLHRRVAYMAKEFLASSGGFGPPSVEFEYWDPDASLVFGSHATGRDDIRVRLTFSVVSSKESFWPRLIALGSLATIPTWGVNRRDLFADVWAGEKKIFSECYSERHRVVVWLPFVFAAPFVDIATTKTTERQMGHFLVDLHEAIAALFPGVHLGAASSRWPSRAS